MLSYADTGVDVIQDAAGHLLSDIGRIAGPGMREAAARVAARPSSDLQHLRPEQLLRQLLWIASVANGQSVPVSAEPGYLFIVRRNLLDRVRDELLALWQEKPISAERMMHTLNGLQRVQRALVPDPEQAFSVELADAGAADLVVEVAHDMRSPLTSILFLAEMLHKGQSGPISDVQRRQLGIMYSAALGLVGMASDMIEIARGGHQLSMRQATPFSVNEILQSVGDLVAPMAEEKRIELRLQQLACDHRSGLSVPLSRILLNLTTNALKFTQEGFVEVGVRSTRGSMVEFSVRDTGPGISESAQNLLFQPFRREPARESGYYFSGTGLGLAMCRRLTHALGSQLILETSPAWGTRFSFEVDLPIVQLL